MEGAWVARTTADAEKVCLREHRASLFDVLYWELYYYTHDVGAGDAQEKLNYIGLSSVGVCGYSSRRQNAVEGSGYGGGQAILYWEEVAFYPVSFGN